MTVPAASCLRMRRRHRREAEGGGWEGGGSSLMASILGHDFGRQKVRISIAWLSTNRFFKVTYMPP